MSIILNGTLYTNAQGLGPLTVVPLPDSPTADQRKRSPHTAPGQVMLISARPCLGPLQGHLSHPSSPVSARQRERDFSARPSGVSCCCPEDQGILILNACDIKGPISSLISSPFFPDPSPRSRDSDFSRLLLGRPLIGR